MRIKNKISIILLFLLAIGMVTATIYIVLNEERTQVIGFKSDDVAWNTGFRSVSDFETCKSYKDVMSSEALMDCYGFKELK